MITASETAKEKGTIIFELSFTDEDDVAVTPQSVVWSLTDFLGDIINSRDQEAVSELSTTVSIVLFGDDLALSTNERFQSRVNRYLAIEATYNSDLGDDLPITETVRFKIENLKGIE